MILKNVHFILVRPQIGENIGAVARAIKNFNIKKLRIINPRCQWPNEKALATYGEVINSFHFFKAYYHYARLLDKNGKKNEAIDYMKSIVGSSKDLPDYKLEKERFWIDEAYKYLRKNGIELA